MSSQVEEKIKKLKKFVDVEIEISGTELCQVLDIIEEITDAYKEEKERNKQVVLNLFD